MNKFTFKQFKFHSKPSGVNHIPVFEACSAQRSCRPETGRVRAPVGKGGAAALKTNAGAASPGTVARSQGGWGPCCAGSPPHHTADHTEPFPGPDRAAGAERDGSREKGFVSSLGQI